MQLEIYEMIGQAISNSRRAGGEVRFASREAFSLFLCWHILAFGLTLFCLLGVFFFPPPPFTFGMIALSELPAARGLVSAKQPLPHLEPQPHGLG